MAGDHYSTLISALAFRLLAPEIGRGEDRRLLVPRRDAEPARLVELPCMPIDVINTSLPPDDDLLRDTLEPVMEVQRMSTFANAALINRAVAAMPSDHSYVNVGVWLGFSLFAGMAGNGDRRCVGVDNFSEFGGPREQFGERFDRLRSTSHEFHEMDYRDYFANVHEGPIGVYFYDGDHSYENQLRGLEIAEPFLGEECVVLVDDTNWGEPHRATFDFIDASDRAWEVLLDRTTAENGHPTWWNGMLVLRTTHLHTTPKRSVEHPERGRRRPPRHYDPVRIEPEPAPVEIVVDCGGATREQVDAAVAAARAQTWPATGVVLAGTAQSPELGDATAATRSPFVGIAHARVPLHPSAVEIALGFPAFCEFNTPPGPGFFERLERQLALRRDIASVVPLGSRFAFARSGVAIPNLLDGREAVAFLGERDGERGARPESDDEAVERLDSVLAEGTRFFALAWAAFDWLDAYPRFRARLEATGDALLATDRVRVFDLGR